MDEFHTAKGAYLVAANITRFLILVLCITLTSLSLSVASHAAPPSQELRSVAPGLLTWTPDGQRLAVTSCGGIALYDIQQLDEPHARFAETLGYSIVYVAINADGTRIATQHDPDVLSALNLDDDLRTGLGWVWDVERGERAFELTGHDLLRRVDAVTFSPDGALVAYGGLADGLIHVRDAVSGAEVVVLNPVADDSGWEPGLVIPALTWVGFGPGGDTLASSHASGDIVLWDTTTWRRLAVLHSTNLQVTVAYNTSGDTIVARNSLGFPEVWSTRDGSGLAAYERASIVVDVVGFDADGRGLGVRVDRPLLTVYDLEAGSERSIGFAELVFMETYPDLRFTHLPSTLIYTLYDNEQDVTTIRLLDLATETIPFSVTIPGEVTASSLSPSGALLAVGIDGQVQLWDVGRGEQVGAITLPDAPPPDFG
jgi:WD40 repeat protein